MYFVYSKNAGLNFFFKLFTIHNTLQSATKIVEPLLSAALKNELKNLPHLETQYHHNPIPFPAFRLIYQRGGGGGGGGGELVKVRESRLKIFKNIN